MFVNVSVEWFRHYLAEFRPRQHRRPRGLALYSAAIAVADEGVLDAAVLAGRRCGVKREQFYEVALQSYLFLGFPRMLLAADHLSRSFPGQTPGCTLEQVQSWEAAAWFTDGLNMCRRVYGGTFDRLRKKVESFAPEAFRWMVIEGYGKVLSRPGLGIVERELAIVACLMMENRQKQLRSHIMGAINVGTPPALVARVIDDLGRATGDSYAAAVALLKKLGYK